MKQSTLFSMMGGANSRTVPPSAASKSKCGTTTSTSTTTAVVGKENVLTTPDTVVAVVENGGSDQDVAVLDEDPMSDSNPEPDEEDSPLGKFEKKQVVSYEDFINSNTDLNSDRKSEKNVDISNNNYDKTRCVVTDTQGKTIQSESMNAGSCSSEGEGQGHDESGLIPDGDARKRKCDQQSMSYQDFLGMFKPASVSGDDAVNDAGTLVEQGIEDTDGCEGSVVPAKPVGCRSIASFFKPVSNNKPVVSKSSKTDGSSTFVVTAEVHSEPRMEWEGETPGKRMKTKLEASDPVRGNSKRSTKTATKKDESAEIVLISSSVVVSESDTTTRKKRKLENTEGTSRESHLQSQPKRKKKTSDSPQNDQSVDKEGPRSKHSSNVKSTTASGQCTLSFGASGLTLNKEKPKQLTVHKSPDASGETDTKKDCLKLPQEKQGQEEEKSDEKKSTRKKLKLKTSAKVSQNVEERGEDADLRSGENQQAVSDTIMCDDGKDGGDGDNSRSRLTQPELVTNTDASSSTCTTATEGRRSGRLRLRQPRAAEVKQKPECQDAGKEGLEEEKETSSLSNANVVGGDDAPSTPGVRRSSRIKHHAESAKKAEEVVEVTTSDDSDDDKKKETKTGDGKNDKAKKSGKVLGQLTDGSGNSSKVPRKLAPIFTKLKQAQAEQAKPPPPPPPPLTAEELERQRARRAFLMSGVPEEVKLAKAAMDLQALPEYPPFPCPSHVCQLEEGEEEGSDGAIGGVAVSSLQAGKLCRALQPISDRCLDDDRVFDGMERWESLGWARRCVEEGPGHAGPRLLFQDFTSHPPVDHRQRDSLLQELSVTDKTFPFRQALAQFAAVKEATRVKEAEPVTPNHHDGSDGDVIVVDDMAPSGNAHSLSGKTAISCGNGVLWTDEHPAGPEYFVGNGKSFSQLRVWLEQWQEELRREATKAMKKGGNNKAGRDAAKKARDWSDDSDFNSSDEDEDCGLCNTVLITGPHGVGKTSAVYCLAKELGFKVFEVNPTSLRSGKQLLSQLEEATQSHRVSHSGLPLSGGMGTPPVGTAHKAKQTQGIPKPAEKTSACKAFSAFFKASSTAKPQKPAGRKTDRGRKPADVVVIDDTKTETGRKKKDAAPRSDRKRGRKKKEEATINPVDDIPDVAATSASSTPNPLNISSASIILFDEADVVLEEDRGFLSTVQQFMSCTKIPIVLTATRPALHTQLSPRHEHIAMRRPSVKTVSSFIHTVCLARGVRVDHTSLMRAVRMLKQDIRRCLLFAQLWCQSGGGSTRVVRSQDTSLSQNTRPSEASGFVATTVTSNHVSRGNVVTSDNSNDSSDFLSLRLSSRRRRRPAQLVDDDDDDNSNGNDKPSDSDSNSRGVTKRAQCSSSKSSSLLPNPNREVAVSDRIATTTQQQQQQGQTTETGSGDVLVLPPVHVGCHMSLIGLGHHASMNNVPSIVARLVQEPLLDINDVVDEINHLESYLPCNLVYRAALHCCPLAKSDPLPVRLTIQAPTSTQPLHTKKRRRIIEGDWLDSDGSDDDGGGLDGNGCGSSGDVVGNTEDGDKGVEGGNGVEDSESMDVDNDDDARAVGQDSNTISVAAMTVSENNIPPTGRANNVECDDTRSEVGTKTPTPSVGDKVCEMSLTLEDGSVKKEKISSFTSNYLKVLWRFYDSNSSVQSLYGASGVFKSSDDDRCLLPGYSDQEVLERETDDAGCVRHRTLSEDIRGCVELLAARMLVKGVEGYRHRGGDGGREQEVGLADKGVEGLREEEEESSIRDCDRADEEENCLPVGVEVPDVWTLVGSDFDDMSQDASIKNVASCVGSGGQGSRSSYLHLDYLPALREMCRWEHHRQQSHAKRRFNHYLDYIGMSNMRDSTRLSLASTYSVTSP